MRSKTIEINNKEHFLQISDYQKSDAKIKLNRFPIRFPNKLETVRLIP